MKASTRLRNAASWSMAEPCTLPGRISRRLFVAADAAYSERASLTNGSSVSEAAKNVGAGSRVTACKAFNGPNEAGAERLTTAAGADAREALPIRLAIAPI